MASNFTNTNIFSAEPLATGVVFVAPVGTAGPTTATSALNAAFVDLGYTGTDGFNEKNDRKIDLKRSFGGAVVKVLQTDYSASLEFTFMESLNANVLKAVFGASNVQITPATSSTGTLIQVNKNRRKLSPQAWVIDTWDDELGSKYRNYAPNAQVTTVADIKVVHTDVIEYKITLECLEYQGMDNIITLIDDNVSSTGAIISPFTLGS